MVILQPEKTLAFQPTSPNIWTRQIIVLYHPISKKKTYTIMKYGIAILSIIPIRKAPKEQSEMISQILFGETYTIHESINDWLKIKLHFDNYIGWISKNMVHYISEEEFEKINLSDVFVSTEPVNKVVCVKNSPQQIVAGSSFPAFHKEDKNFYIEGIKCVFTGQYSIVNKNEIRTSLTHQAKKYLNTPYLWGGRSPFGIDCSGFTQIVYKIHGINILRDASQQITQGAKIESLEKADMGDLAFFQNREGKITHVGMLISKTEIIHASGHVRIDKIDEKGIINSETNEYSHFLREFRTYIKS